MTNNFGLFFLLLIVLPTVLSFTIGSGFTVNDPKKPKEAATDPKAAENKDKGVAIGSTFNVGRRKGNEERFAIGSSIAAGRRLDESENRADDNNSDDDETVQEEEKRADDEDDSNDDEDEEEEAVEDEQGEDEPSTRADDSVDNVQRADEPKARFGIGSQMNVGKGGMSTSMNVGRKDDANQRFGIGSSLNVDTGADKKKRIDGTPTPNCAYPNATLSRLHFFNCGGSTLPLQLISARLHHGNTNAVIYPPIANQPMVLVLKIYNNGQMIYDEHIAIDVFEWKQSAVTGKCYWEEMDDLGAFDNFNGCAFAHDCPVPQRLSTIRVPLHFPHFRKMVNQLKDGHAYQLRLRITDTSRGMKNAVEAGCFVAQTRVA